MNFLLLLWLPGWKTFTEEFGKAKLTQLMLLAEQYGAQSGFTVLIVVKSINGMAVKNKKATLLFKGSLTTGKLVDFF